MPRASQLIFIWPFTRAMDLLYDRISLVKYLELLNSSNKVDLVISGRSDQTFKRVTSLAFCNLIGPPKSWRTDPKQYSRAVSQTLPPRVYPERTKRCGGRGLVSRLTLCFIPIIIKFYFGHYLLYRLLCCLSPYLGAKLMNL